MQFIGHEDGYAEENLQHNQATRVFGTHRGKWLARKGGPKVPAREPGDGDLSPIEDAPGSYVKVRLSE
jgi:poly(3-hydroxyalkanoate) synthetase